MSHVHALDESVLRELPQLGSQGLCQVINQIMIAQQMLVRLPDSAFSTDQRRIEIEKQLDTLGSDLVFEHNNRRALHEAKTENNHGY